MALTSPTPVNAAATVTTTNGLGADTYLSNDGQNAGQGPTVAHGDENGFQHRVFTGTRMKVLYARFDKPTDLINYSGSTITLNFTGANRTRTCTVYGLNDGDAGEMWAEATTSYSNAPGIVWTTNTPLAEFPTIDTNRMTTLGTWDWQAATGQQTSEPATLDLAPFLAADTDGLVTFLFVTTSDGSQSYFGTTKEATNGLEAVLTMPNAVVDPGLSNLTWRVGDDVWDINTTANWDDGTGSAVYQEVSGIGSRVLLDDTSSGASPITITLDTTVVPRSFTNNSTKDYTISGIGKISGATGITKEGSGTLALNTSGLNDFLGPVDLKAGVLDFASGNLGTYSAIPAAINFNGGTLRYASGNADDISVHTITFNADAVIDTGGNTVFFINGIGSNGTGGLTKTGPGELWIAGVNPYPGNTVVSEGSLVYNAATTPNSAAFVVESGATLNATLITSLDLNGQILAGTGSVDGALNAQAGSVVSPATNGVAGTLTILNSGFNGALQLNGGSLAIDISDSTSDSIVVNGNVELNSGSVALNVTGVLANGTYKLIDYTGFLTGSAASIAVTGFSQAGQIAFLSDATPNQIDLVIATKGDADLVWQGNVNNLWDVENTANWLSNGVGTVFLQGDAVTFDATGAGQPNVDLTGALFPASVTVSGSTDYTLSTTSGGKLTGATGLSKSGNSTLTILTDNNNTGLISNSAGSTLQVGDGATASHIGAGGFDNEGELIFNPAFGDNRTVGAITGSGNVTQNGQAVLTAGGNPNYTGATTIGAGATLQLGNGGAATIQTASVANEGTFVINSSADQTLTTPITGSGGFSKQGGGALTVNSLGYTGTTTVGGGSMVLGGEDVIPGVLTVTTGGTLDMNGFDQSIVGLTTPIGGGGQITNSAAITNVLTVSNAGGNDASSALNGPIQLVKLGAGELILRSAGSMSGGTRVGEGTLQIRDTDAALGAGPIILSNNVAFQFDNFPGNELTVVEGAAATLLARALGDGYGGAVVSGDDNSTIIIGNGVSFNVNTAQQFENFTGTVLVSTNASAEIRFSSTSLTTNGGGLTKFVLQGPGLIHTRNGTSENEGAGIFMGSLEGDAGARLEGATSQNRVTRYVIGGNNLSTEFAGTVGLAAGGGNPVAISKVGTGTLTLSGTNRYEAATIVSGGVLALVGPEANPTNTSSVSVELPGVLDVSGLADGTLYLANSNSVSLAGDGTINGSVVVDAAVPTVSVTPGASIGTLTITNSLTLSANSAITMEVATGNSSDQISANSFTLGGASITVTNVGGSSLHTGDTFQLFNQAVSGFGAVTLPAEDAYGTYTWNNSLGADGTVSVATATPKVDTTPTNLTAIINGGNIELSWPESHIGWLVQSNSVGVVDTDSWFDISGSGTTNMLSLPFDAEKTNVFFRMVLP